MALKKEIYYRQWRLVKQRRKLGKPYWLQDGQFVYHGLCGTTRWETTQEWNYSSREEALEALKKMPATWGGDRSGLLGGS